MQILEKLKILSDAAKYDVSCSSSGSNRENQDGLGNGAYSGICHTWTEDGRCVSLLKVLMTNYCIYDCVYCLNRRKNDIQRAEFTVDEVVNLTINFYKRNYIEGLFLSSGVIKSPDHTMERLYLIAKKLRTEHGFYGYIHLKAIPGASKDLIRKAGLYADRMSLNIELPSEESLKLLAPQKKRDDILKPMKYIGDEYTYTKEEKKKYKKKANFVPAGQSTQMIVGASPETDYQIVNLAESFYQKMSMKRVYYSAYIPVNKDNKLPAITIPPTLRENRLYQADWLMRFYGFKAKEILNESDPFLDTRFDPKLAWALRNLDQFPVEINRADYETILRIPGVGVKSALRIIKNRRVANLNYEDLKKIGIVLKRAKYFITCKGKSFERYKMDKIYIEDRLLRAQFKTSQLKLF